MQKLWEIIEGKIRKLKVNPKALFTFPDDKPQDRQT